jgi:quercetin dioxygenase-like cupin family protein
VSDQNRCNSWVIAIAAAGLALLPLQLLAAEPPPAAAGGKVTTVLSTRDLVGSPDKEIIMETVDYAPGATSAPHRHNAQVFIYVLVGRVTMQVKGGPKQTLGRGQTFYESPTDIHTVSANASGSEPARILVVMIKEKGKPATTPVAADEAH